MTVGIIAAHAVIGAAAQGASVRGHRVTRSDASVSSLAVALPTETQVGDLLVMSAAGSWDVQATSASGWTELSRQNGTWVNGGLWSKVATATDISNGTVTVNFGGATPCSGVMYALAGASKSYVLRADRQPNGDGDASLPAYGPAGDVLLLDAIRRSGGSDVPTIGRGTTVATAASNGSGLYSYRHNTESLTVDDGSLALFDVLSGAEGHWYTTVRVAAPYTPPSLTGYDNAVSLRSPDAYFRLSETHPGGWRDVSGNDRILFPDSGTVDGIATGGPTLTGGLASGRAIFTSGRASCSLDPAATSTYSVVGWVKTTVTGYQYLFGSRGAGIPGLGCYIGGAPVSGGGAGTVNWGVSHDSVWRGRKTTETINDGAWHHLAVVFNSAGGSILTTDFSIYIDGALATLTDSNYATTNAPIDMSNWHVGGNPDDGGGLFTGDFSRLALIPTALTAQQVSDLYLAA